MQNPNQPKANPFADILSLDGWLMPGEEAGHHSLHADVVFSEGRLGGEEDSEVRFKLALKRAELVVILSNTEPADILKPSVSRDGPAIEGKRTTDSSSEVSAGMSGGFELGASPAGVSGSAKVAAQGSAERKAKDHTTTVEKLGPIAVKHTQTADGDHRWEMTPGVRKLLDGRPWDAAAKPRFTVIDLRQPGSTSLPVVVHLEIRCLREDLHISDISPKSKPTLKSFVESRFKDQKLFAAEAYILQKLTKSGLDVSDISEDYCRISLASAPVELS